MRFIYESTFIMLRYSILTSEICQASCHRKFLVATMMQNDLKPTRGVPITANFISQLKLKLNLNGNQSPPLRRLL